MTPFRVPSLSLLIMVCRVRETFLYVALVIFLCATFYHHYLRHSAAIIPFTTANSAANHVIHENLSDGAGVPAHATITIPLKITTSTSPQIISTTAVLLPDWEVLVIVNPETTPSTDHPDGYSCLFANNEVSPARFSGFLQFPDRETFSCNIPLKARRKVPLRQPVLLKSPEEYRKAQSPLPPPLIRWSYLVYDSLTTEDDVVLFVKGVNTRQGINRHPSEFRCIFGEDAVDAVRTSVTSSMQEVFRCKRPDLTPVTHIGGESDPPLLKVSLELVAENRVVPSVAYYTSPRKLESRNGKSLLCATTMVYNVSKFLREWVFYHSKVGVEKFIFYDNGSDDDLGGAAAEIAAEGFDVNTYSWRWPKTQESGFSHSSIYAKDVCKWMMFLDVDEFLYSPNWNDLPEPSKLLLNPPIILQNSPGFGQIMVSCREFGPSGQKVHPSAGVTQGYNCRRKIENRHKSMVLLDAVDDSLLNAIHHFQLREGYKSKKMNTTAMVVNHYKYQAWPEFKAKFRRRVSAYVVDWGKKSNPNSKDRTPGLGYIPVEPEEWATFFCELRDEGLKNLVSRWFGNGSGHETRMPWQR